MTLTLFASVMVVLSLAFARHCCPKLRDLLAGLWNRRRQDILHLKCLNGFDFFRDRLHDWSNLILVTAVASLLPVFIWDPDRLLLAGAIVAWIFSLRYFARYHVASSLLRQASLPLEYDGFGSYARAADDWKAEATEAKWKGTRCSLVAACWSAGVIGTWL